MNMKPYRNALIAVICTLLLEGVFVVYRASIIGNHMSDPLRFVMKAGLFVSTFPFLPIEPILRSMGVQLSGFTMGVNTVVLGTGPLFWGTVVFFLSRRRMNMPWLEIVGLRIAGCILSLLIGWTAFLLLVLFVSPACRHIMIENGFADGLKHSFDLVLRAVAASADVATLANVACVLIFILAPRSWPIWRWHIATICGLVGGVVAGIMIPLFHGLPISGLVITFTAFTGSTACLTASLISRRLHDG